MNNIEGLDQNRQTAAPAKEKRVPVVFEGYGRTSGKMRTDFKILWPAYGEEFELATDEGAMHGGDGTAPPPLALFTTALGACVMTQIRAFAKMLKIEVKDVNVHVRMEWELIQKGKEPYETAPVGFTMDVEIDSDAPVEDIRRLMETAKKGCFVEQTLGRTNKVSHRLMLDDQWVEL
jgi:uncharacterized OsmC-like protein